MQESKSQEAPTGGTARKIALKSPVSKAAPLAGAGDGMDVEAGGRGALVEGGLAGGSFGPVSGFPLGVDVAFPLALESAAGAAWGQQAK